MKRIRIFDTTLRDGEQAPGASLTPEEKIRLAHQLAKLGVDVLEPGFPISSPGDFQAVQAISRAVEGVEICGFARSVKGDIDAALKATEDASFRRIHMFLSSSDIHLDFQLRKSREQVIAMARDVVAYAKQFVDRIEFSPMDATRTGEEFLFEMIEAVIAEGATIINIPDTVGYALPDEYAGIFRRVRQSVRGGDTVEYSAHCHNDLGLAVANSLAAISAGVTQVEVTVGGVGERAGNCSLEELAMAIETRKLALQAETGIRSEEIYRTSRMVSRAMHFPIAFNKPIIGRNAFRHEAGIHQDGLLKSRNTYEIMDPEKMGIPRSMIVLGKHSGRHAIRHQIGELGIRLSDTEMESFYSSFKEYADTRKTVTDDELIALAGTAVNRNLDRFALADIQVVSGSNTTRVASATITDNETGSSASYSSVGQGPVEALIGCLKQAMPFPVEFVDLELHSLSAGETAGGQAEIIIEAENQEFTGSAEDKDILFAVARAFVAACNRACRSGIGADAVANGETAADDSVGAPDALLIP
ncbi:2-isopropylmalate synthase [Gorillibacterium massiliense]|uniref:2-isopropylmalate synthase n=1 Tax=Gorillibacterium massiliense TaxID=1280390 RepID=UPI0009DEEF6E|nr:2-isopropylmalate synthase [Gorillibacterium massiliense]